MVDLLGKRPFEIQDDMVRSSPLPLFFLSLHFSLTRSRALPLSSPTG